jgi:hypothetical protein
MIYEFRASGKMGIDGEDVPDGTIVATVSTQFPLDNILAGIRLSQFNVTANDTKVAAKVARARPPLEPPYVDLTDETTKGQTPPLRRGEATKTK